MGLKVPTGYPCPTLNDTCDEPTEASGGMNKRLRVCRGLGKRSTPLELAFTPIIFIYSFQKPFLVLE